MTSFEIKLLIYKNNYSVTILASWTYNEQDLSVTKQHAWLCECLTYFTIVDFGPTDPRQGSRQGSYVPSFIKIGQFKLQCLYFQAMIYQEILPIY